eukprot:TRINITY_DN6172_c0_g1_i3.p2 TRINITY_DN6172_c0_g1~~TRINITY_DN6172_c0_g1_i3.p2  ORF type:complete len:120 (-),score=20.21 TRINITY_DN6172_c0_g1_i3:404-763(-)
MADFASTSADWLPSPLFSPIGNPLLNRKNALYLGCVKEGKHVKYLYSENSDDGDQKLKSNVYNRCDFNPVELLGKSKKVPIYPTTDSRRIRHVFEQLLKKIYRKHSRKITGLTLDISRS